MAGTVALDFDGTLHPYSAGWIGTTPADEPPAPDTIRFLAALHQRGFRTVVLSARASYPEGKQGIIDWLRAHDLLRFVDEVTATKPAAIAYVDDRAVVYTGDWTSVMNDVIALSTHPTGHVNRG